MEKWCNKHWDRTHHLALHQTSSEYKSEDDSTETLALECVWQHLDPKITDDLFELPISLNFRHPLRFAVAHRLHGRQLRSPWTLLKPESIKDRDPSVGNMSFEACIVYFAKSNFPSESYTLMAKDFEEDIRVGSQWYKPSPLKAVVDLEVEEQGHAEGYGNEEGESEDVDDVCESKDCFDDEDVAEEYMAL